MTIKLLIADDSALMRRHLKDVFEQQDGYEVRTARNGAEVLAELDGFDPDVITLDINMPVMDGLTCLSRIMVQRPKPVVMVSSLTAAGVEATLQSLSLGAVDFVRKPDGKISLSIDRIAHELRSKVRAAAGARFALTGGRPGIVLVGVSTGGPSTLEEILPRLPGQFPWPVLVGQHMPGGFTGVFARRLNEMSALRVVEATQQMPIEPGTIYVAKGDADLLVLRRGTGFVASPVPASADHLWHPSVTRLGGASVVLRSDRIADEMVAWLTPSDVGSREMSHAARTR